ncbi:MAG: hypothetical protein ACKPKO_64600, partial [Candidatus Fonsibacter sp.]
HERDNLIYQVGLNSNSSKQRNEHDWSEPDSNDSVQRGVCIQFAQDQREYHCRFISGPTGWTDTCKFEPTGNGYFVGTLTTVGDITSTFVKHNVNYWKCISIREFTVIQWKHHSTIGNHQRTKCIINWINQCRNHINVGTSITATGHLTSST